jgi:hypothetical protein
MGKKGQAWRLRGAVILLVLAVVATAWLMTRGDDDESNPSPAAANARIVSEEELTDIASSVGHPVYWAGPMPGTELELTENANGNTLVRYLDDGADVGEGQAEFLAIGSYPMADPAKALDGFAEVPGAIVRRGPDGRKVVTHKRGRTSVYFASPDNSVQVEVYDDSPQRAMGLVLSDKVQPAG